MFGIQLAGNLLQGLVLGAVYGMATMGLSLIFGVLKVVNVGHGAFMMVGAFVALWVFNFLGVDRKSTRLNSSHGYISYAVFCLTKKIIPLEWHFNTNKCRCAYGVSPLCRAA